MTSIKRLVCTAGCVLVITRFSPLDAAVSGPAPDPSQATAQPASRKVTVPTGTQITVRMIDNVDSAATGAGQTYRASIDDPVAIGDQVAIPRGANCTVQVVKVKGTNEMALKLNDISIGGRIYDTATDYAQLKAEGSSKKSKAVKRGVGLGALGAGVGALAGGGKGAGIGAAIGGGVGAISAAAAKGPHLKIPAESRLTFTLKSPLPMG